VQTELDNIAMESASGLIFGLAAFGFGLIIGSFLNVVIHRLPRDESIVLPPSHCPECGYQIKPYDNIPVISYVLLRGRCRSCRTGISPIYPIVELLVGSSYLLFFLLRRGITPEFLVDVIFVSLVIPLVFIDFEHMLLPNAITYPGLIVGLISRLLVPIPYLEQLRAAPAFSAWPAWAVSGVGSVLGALAGGGILWLIRKAYFLSMHREGMGPGDVKMMFMVGAFLGWQLTIVTIFLAALGGSVIGLLLIALRGGTMKTAIPFGVFLGPASLVSLAVGEKAVAWYVGLLH
jgi:leader peptidase (prepilin peptidase)/N-methyltransferase